MSSANLPKSVLSSGSSDEKTEDAALTALKCTRFYEILQTNASNSVQDTHQNCIKNLRKELDFLKDTKWKYESIDKYIGQSSE